MNGSKSCSDVLLQFRERYKGYKIPVSSLRTGTFMKSINDAHGGVVDGALEMASVEEEDDDAGLLEDAGELDAEEELEEGKAKRKSKKKQQHNRNG